MVISNSIFVILIHHLGIVSQPEDVISLVKENSSTHRFCTFGVGSDVDKQFTKKIAALTGGRSEFISNDTQLEQKCVYYLSKFIEKFPVLMTQVNVDFHSEFVSQAPSNICAIFRKDCKVIYAMGKQLGEEVEISYMVSALTFNLNTYMVCRTIKAKREKRGSKSPMRRLFLTRIICCID